MSTETFGWLNSTAELEAFVERALSERALAFDTEFVREGRYFPDVALVSMATSREIVLLDPLAVDMAPLRELLSSSLCWVMHAGSQDLEILTLALDATPTEYFDTQIAGAFLGHGTASLEKTARAMLNVSLDKGATLTDWMRRPLDDAACAYAASDVAHLLEIRRVQMEKLEAAGRLEWVLDECRSERARSRKPRDPETVWWKLRGAAKLRGRKAMTAQVVAAKRDSIARRKNRPASTVLSDLALQAIAQRAPEDVAALERVRGVSRGFVRSEDGKALLAAIASAQSRSLDELRLAPSRNGDGVTHHAMSLVQAWLRHRATSLKIEGSFLATKKDLQAYFLKRPSRLDDGWRAEVIGREIEAIAAGTLGLAVDGDGLCLVEM